MLCNSTMGDEMISRPRRISISAQRVGSAPSLMPLMFLNAIKKKSMEELASFIANPDFNINVVQDNLTGIKFALDMEWLEGIHCLLERPILSLDSVPTILHKLSSILPTQEFQKYAECFDLAVAKGADVNRADSKGKKPLHLAVKHKNVLATECLLKHDAKVTYIDYEGLSACYYVIEGNLDGHAELFLKYNKNMQNKVTSTAAAKYSPTVALMAAIFPDLEDKVKERLFIAAIEMGHINQVKYYFENRISTTTVRQLDNKHIYYIAATKGHFKLLSYLLKQNLILPRSEWEHSILYYLFNNTPNNPYDEAKLEKLVKKLIKGKDINSRNSQGETILHQACFRGQISAIHLLLAHGARVDIQQYGGDTPFHYAVRNNKALLILEALAKGSNRDAMYTALTAQGVEGTCLQMAEKYQLKDVITFIQYLM